MMIAMKRLQICIEEELDAALAGLAVREGISKAALIRRFVSEGLGLPPSGDPLDQLVGQYDEEPGSIDDVVYGPKSVESLFRNAGNQVRPE
jgi:hypothetical protein